MKRSSVLVKLLTALFAFAFLNSCDSGGGGGSSGGGTTPSNKSSITIKLSSDTSSDILGDFGAAESKSFYYGVSFSGGGKKFGPKYGSEGDTLLFDDVPYGTYTFVLDIYLDTTKKITLGTKKLSQSVKDENTVVNFDLHYSDYEDYYIVSDAETFVNALSGKTADGTGDIERSRMVAGDETTYAKIYVTKDLSIAGGLIDPDEGLGFSDGTYGAVVYLGGNTVTSEAGWSFGRNINVVFTNGSLSVPSINLNDASSSLSFDGITISQLADAAGELVSQTTGAITFSNGSKITSGNTCAAVYGGTLKFDDTEVSYDGNDDAAVMQYDGTVIVTGGSIITSGQKTVSMMGGTFVMLGGMVSTTGSGSAVGLAGSVFALVDSYDGMTATGANSVSSIAIDNYDTDAEPACILFGGNSQVDEIQVNSYPLNIAQISAADSSLEYCAGAIEGCGTTDTTKLFKQNCTDFTLPDGFTWVDALELDTSYFEVGSGYSWKPDSGDSAGGAINYWYVAEREP